MADITEAQEMAFAELHMTGQPVRSRRLVKKLLGRSYVHPDWPNRQAFIAPGLHRSQAVSMVEVIANDLYGSLPRRQATERRAGTLAKKGAAHG